MTFTFLRYGDGNTLRQHRYFGLPAYSADNLTSDLARGYGPSVVFSAESGINFCSEWGAICEVTPASMGPSRNM